MRTICIKCGHCHKHRVPRTIYWRCFAPWPKTIDPVTGELIPIWEDCHDKNKGDCINFKPTQGCWEWLKKALGA